MQRINVKYWRADSSQCKIKIMLGDVISQSIEINEIKVIDGCLNLTMYYSPLFP